jgi:general secretion pathway protein L
VIAALARIGVAAPMLEMPRGDGPPHLIPLTSPDFFLLRRRRLQLALAGGLCAVLTLVAVALPFARQALAVADLDARIQALRPRLAAVETLRRRAAGDAAGADVLARERAQLGDALQVLATVTEILPDDTFLTEFTLSQGKLGIRGQSATAARLIAALAAEPTLRNPAFAAPVTRIDSGHAELFSIRAELAP